MHWGIVGGDQLQLGTAWSPSVRTRSTSIATASGNGNYDEATFVYEQVTGDFDKEVRVEYVDPSSQWGRAA